MSKWDKLRSKIVGGRSDHNIEFHDLTGFLTRLGFDERIGGGHHTFSMERVEEIISLQPKLDGKAKAYQVKQVREIIGKYDL